MEGRKRTCNLLYDSGTNVNLIRHAYAKELGLSGSTVSQSLQVTGREPEQQQTVLYNIPLRRASGEIEHITAYGIPDITADLTPVSIAPIIIFFSGIRLKDIQRPTGKVDLLLGVHEARLFPKSLDSHDNILLQTSVFGSGLVLSGYHPLIKSEGVCPPQQAQALHVRSHLVLAEHTSSYPAASVSPTSTGGGGAGVQGDCRKVCALQASRTSLSRGGGGEGPGTPAPALRPQFPCLREG